MLASACYFKQVVFFFFFKQISLPSFSDFWFMLQRGLETLELDSYWIKLKCKMLYWAILAQLLIIQIHGTSKPLPRNSLLQ